MPCTGHPDLDDHVIFNILKERKLTGGVAGDLDPRIVRDCLVELVPPLAEVYREAVDCHEWPGLWKIEK